MHNWLFQICNAKSMRALETNVACLDVCAGEFYFDFIYLMFILYSMNFYNFERKICLEHSVAIRLSQNIYAVGGGLNAMSSFWYRLFVRINIFTCKKSFSCAIFIKTSQKETHDLLGLAPVSFHFLISSVTPAKGWRRKVCINWIRQRRHCPLITRTGLLFTKNNYS